MIARGSWVFIFCLSGALALAVEPEGAVPTRQSQVPHRRIRRTYDQRVQIHQPGAETATEQPPDKEKFVPGEVPSQDVAPDRLLTRPSFTPPPPPAGLRRDGEEGEKEDSEDDLWILKSPEAVLGVSTSKSASSMLGGWIAENTESQKKDEEEAEEEENAAESNGEEELPGLNLLTGQEPGPHSLLSHTESQASNATERARSSSGSDHSDPSLGLKPEEDRFAPRNDPALNPIVVIQDVGRPSDSVPEVPAPALPPPTPEMRPESSAPVRAASSDAGSFSTKWEPPSFSPSRAPDPSAGSYGRVGEIFGPATPSRAPSSLGLPPPGAGFGSGPAPLPDSRFKSFGTPGPLLPPLRTERSAGPPNTPAQPFLPGRFEP